MLETIISLVSIVVTLISIIVTLTNTRQTYEKHEHQKSNRRTPK